MEHTSESLRMLQEMFPLVESETLRQLLHSAHGSLEQCTEYLLQQHPDDPLSSQQTNSDNTPKTRQKDLFHSLPLVSVDAILDLQTITDLARLSAVSAEFYRIVCRHLSHIHRLSFERKRHWEDWRILNMIGRFPNLKSLSLAKCNRFHAFSLLSTQIRSNVPLQRLVLASCTQLDDDLLRGMLELLTNIPDIDLSGTSISDESLFVLARRMEQIRSLSLSGCSFITDVGLTMLLQRAPKSLKELDISATDVSMESLSLLGRTAIEQLDLSKCKRVARLEINSDTLTSLKLVSTHTIQSIVLETAKLSVLNASSCKNLHRLEIEGCSRLLQLNLSGCRGLGTFLGTQSCKSLQSLNLYNCHQIPRAALQNLLKASSNTLVELCLSGLLQMDEELVMFIKYNCPNVDSLSLQGCKNVPKGLISK